MTTTKLIIDNAAKDPNSLNRIRYRICKLASDIIAYLLEALDVIEIPPDPPEQAGRSLYERLEISGMRSQLLRRTTDLKKNIGGASRVLEVLREMTHVVSEEKMFDLNQSLELNTKRMIEQHEANERAALSLQLLQVVFAGMLAFDLLDRITGEWTVINAVWMESLSQYIKAVPTLWLCASLLTWLAIAVGMLKLYNYMAHTSQGILTVRVKLNRKIFVNKLIEVLSTKTRSFEEWYTPEGSKRELVRVTYEENDPREWGGAKPTIVVDYDHQNGYLLSVQIEYNKRKASKLLAFNSGDLWEKVEKELTNMKIWDDKGADHSDQDLAIQKRMRIDRMIENQQLEEEEGGDD